MAIMVLVLITNLIPDPQRSKEEKLITRPMLSQYPPMIGHMAKANKEIPHRMVRLTLLMDTIRTKLLPAVRPICHHQSIKHLRSLREELSYMITTANRDKAVTLAAETRIHDEKLVEMADPSKGNNLGMTTTHTAEATRISIDFPAAAMKNGKALAAMMMIQLHEEQREDIAVAETHRRTSRAKDVTPYHPHQAVHMAAAVAAQLGHTAPENIRRMMSTHTSILVDSVGPPSAEVCRTTTSFP
jgi:hypothetical protein